MGSILCRLTTTPSSTRRSLELSRLWRRLDVTSSKYNDKGMYYFLQFQIYFCVSILKVNFLFFFENFYFKFFKIYFICVNGGYPKPTLPTIQAMGIIPPYLTTSTKFNQQRKVLRFYQGFKHCYLTN